LGGNRVQTVIHQGLADSHRYSSHLGIAEFIDAGGHAHREDMQLAVEHEVDDTDAIKQHQGMIFAVSALVQWALVGSRHLCRAWVLNLNVTEELWQYIQLTGDVVVCFELEKFLSLLSIRTLGANNDDGMLAVIST